jgi:hypothetical protein
MGVDSTIAPSVTYRTPQQVLLRRRIEGLIRLAAPVLDLVLFAGERVSRVAGRGQVDPEPPHRLGGPPERRV